MYIAMNNTVVKTQQDCIHEEKRKAQQLIDELERLSAYLQNDGENNILADECKETVMELKKCMDRREDFFAWFSHSLNSLENQNDRIEEQIHKILTR